MSAALMRSRRFAPMFWTQFLSALSDNFVKNALVMLIVFQIGGTAGAQLVALAGGVFILPFFILSGLGGELADRYDKALMARRLKLAEIPVAGIAALGFVLHSVPVLFVALAAFGVIGALFSPIKYGILPVHLETRELPAGNALVEGATFLAILAGTIAGGYAVANGIAGWPVVAVVLALAVMCYLASRFIPETGEAAPHLAITRNPVTSTVHLLRDLRKDRRIWIGAMITSWFWLVGAVALSLLPSLMKDLVGGTQSVITLALVVFTVGMSLFETALLRQAMWDINAQPTLFHRAFFERWSEPPTDFSLDLFAYALATRSNLEIRRFPVAFGPRAHGRSHWNVDLASKLKFIRRTVSFSLNLRHRL